MGACNHPGAGKGPPIRKTTLKRDLLYILFVGVVAVFALQVAIRVFRELPALYRLEAQSDRNAVRQVQLSLRSPVRLLETLVLDYSIWDDTYDFVEMTPDSQEWIDYLDFAFEQPWDTFFLHDVNGFIYLDSDDALVYRLTLDPKTGVSCPEFDLASPAFREALTGRYRPQDATLHKYGIGRETLGIEITETAMMKGGAEVSTALHEIYAKGVPISLDDFGTGYSSLAMLKTLPIDNVKIDKHFIDGITESLEGKTIVKAVIAMCTEMGLSTTAEGVEVEEQLSFLKEVGCDYVQGYLLNKPINAERMTALMTQTRAPNIQNFRQVSWQRPS